MALHEQTDLDFLIDDLRFYIGDRTRPYDFEDTELRHALIMACKELGKRWRRRYILDTTDYTLSRNSAADFGDTAPPLVEFADHPAFVIQASIIIKESEMRNSVWDLGHWKDDEVSYSNIEGGRQAVNLIKVDRAKLDEWFRKRLFGSSRQSLPGFHLPLNQREGHP